MPSRSMLLVVTLAAAFGALASCSDDGDALSGSTTTSAVPSSTTTITSTTAASVDRCAMRPGPITNVGAEMPQNTDRECDAEAGWRMFFWIGESGDPIYRVQRLDGSTWTDVDYDVACGLDAALLENLGLPESLANEWGDKYDAQC